MKNLFKLAVVAIVLVAFTACGSSDSPEKVAEKFLSALGKKDFDGAKSLATKESQGTIDMVASISKMGVGQDNKEAKEPKIENIKCDTKENKSSCTYTSDGQEQKLELLKENGKWLVSMKKENPMENANTTPVDSTSVSADTTKK